MIEKAAASAADVVLLDLEDSVAPAAKVVAREIVLRGMRELDWGGKTLAVHINSADTEWALEDLLQIVHGAGEALDLIVLP
jgi:citrate lyase subunit beta / citryl-CoA lyase